MTVGDSMVPTAGLLLLMAVSGLSDIESQDRSSKSKTKQPCISKAMRLDLIL